MVNCECFSASPMSYGGYYGNNMMGMNQEQMVWMQQMYMQQMAQYMQM